MDIASLDLIQASAGAEFELLHPGTGQPTGVHLTVRGYDTPEVLQAGKEVYREVMGARVKPDMADVALQRRIANAKAALLDVRGATGSTTTVEQYRALMDKPSHIWLVEQVEQFAGDRKSFFPSAGTD